MWKVLPRLGLIKSLGLVFSVIIFALLFRYILPFVIANDINSTSSFSLALKVSTPATLIFYLIVFLFGKFGWKLLWKTPFLGVMLNKHVCPNLNGKWTGTIKSNFPDENGKPTEKEVQMIISADFFGFSISLDSSDGYQSSKVILSEIYKDPQTGAFYISYIFESEVPFPQESDDRSFEGAGKLQVKYCPEPNTLSGTYWTNRAWQRKQNTAGIINLRKVA